VAISRAKMIRRPEMLSCGVAYPASPTSHWAPLCDEKMWVIESRSQRPRMGFGAVSLAGRVYRTLAGASAFIFAALMRPPQITSRHFVLFMGGITAGIAARGNATSS
jgi:hypothetical protein